jgi:zearalenone synthase (highly reducing iterative type I polyketide synthase)
MPGLCESKRHGFKELSSNINIFDTGLSKVILSVVDYRVSELENDTEAQDTQQLEVDPAEITSVVRWNCSVAIATQEELQKLVLASAPEARVREVIHHLLTRIPCRIRRGDDEASYFIECI